MTDYRGRLDLERGLAFVRYVRGGVRHERTVFASAPDQAVVVHLTCDRPGGLSLDVACDSVHPTVMRPLGGDGLALSGHWDPRPPAPGRASVCFGRVAPGAVPFAGGCGGVPPMATPPMRGLGDLLALVFVVGVFGGPIAAAIHLAHTWGHRAARPWLPGAGVGVGLALAFLAASIGTRA